MRTRFMLMAALCASDVLVGGCAARTPPDPGGGHTQATGSVSTEAPASLDASARRTALAAAHSEAAEQSGEAADSTGWPANIDVVAASLQPGPVPDSNTGHPCRSGTVVVIDLIGTFDNIAVGVPPGGLSSTTDASVHAVVATADLHSGVVCLVGVRTGSVAPDSNATILFSR